MRTNLQIKPFGKFLLLFSISILAIAGIVYACADDGYADASIFSPEAFVSKQYTPFFYDASYWYYKGNMEVDGNNSRFNDLIVTEWDDYLGHQLKKPVLQYLLLHANQRMIDSVQNYINGKISDLKPDSLHFDAAALDKQKAAKMFAYLALAKTCEKFAVAEDRGWYDDTKPVRPAMATVGASLTTALNASKDAFIKQRLWFQLTRYYFFYADTAKSKKLSSNDRILSLFAQYKNTFPKNLTYYRVLGYVAGYYRSKGYYAQANYLYSRCYDYSFEMKIPSKFSFHAQNESDWRQTLALAANKDEKITLWHMLGMEYDPLRAIKEIAALDAKSDKIDLLLIRVVNTRENNDDRMYNLPGRPPADPQIKDSTATDKEAMAEIRLVDSVALTNSTAKLGFWNLAAGYLHYLRKDYKQAGKFYNLAKEQLPADDKLIMAQYRMLVILLDVDTLQRIDASTESRLAEPLNWLSGLKHGKENIPNLRVGNCADVIAALYLKQHDTIKAICFNDTVCDYSDNLKVQKLLELINKPDKTPFERAMLTYYAHTADDLYYLQATQLTYQENIAAAIALMRKMKTSSADLPANPFNSRLNDCHDCDYEAPQKQKFTPLTFLTTIQNITTDLNAGKDKFRNAWLLANAYYNISYYGNARPFFQSDILGYTSYEPGYGKFTPAITDQHAAVKYYLLARKCAQTDEQRARCTFMLSKCERNEAYTRLYTEKNPWDEIEPRVFGKYFKEFKLKYAKTPYYKEVLQECGYFKEYASQKKLTIF